MLIHTTKGLVPVEQLEVWDSITWQDNARVYVTEWRMNGEMVRRDTWVSVLRALDVMAPTGTLG